MRKTHLILLSLAALVSTGCSNESSDVSADISKPEPAPIETPEASVASESSVANEPSVKPSPRLETNEVIRAAMGRVQKALVSVPDTPDAATNAALASTIAQAVDEIEGSLTGEPQGAIKMVIDRLRYAAAMFERGDIQAGLGHANAVLRTYQAIFDHGGAPVARTTQ